MKLDISQRKLLSDIFKDTANYSIAGLVFGQLMTNNIQPLLLGLGLLLYLWFVMLALRFRKGVKEE
jgi:hypothetical protein